MSAGQQRSMQPSLAALAALLDGRTDVRLGIIDWSDPEDARPVLVMDPEPGDAALLWQPGQPTDLYPDERSTLAAAVARLQPGFTADDLPTERPGARWLRRVWLWATAAVLLAVSLLIAVLAREYAWFWVTGVLLVTVPVLFFGGVPGVRRWCASIRQQRQVEAIADRLVGCEGVEDDLLVQLNLQAEAVKDADHQTRADLADHVVAQLRVLTAERNRPDQPRRGCATGLSTARSGVGPRN